MEALTLSPPLSCSDSFIKTEGSKSMSSKTGSANFRASVVGNLGKSYLKTSLVNPRDSSTVFASSSCISVSV